MYLTSFALSLLKCRQVATGDKTPNIAAEMDAIVIAAIRVADMIRIYFVEIEHGESS